MRGSSVWPQILAATAASLILVCAGIDSAWPIMKTIFDLEEVSEFCRGFTLRGGSIFVQSISGICGLLLGFLMVDKLGRRTTLLLMTIPLLVSNAIFIFAKSCALLHFSQFVAGIGIGVAYMVTPMYIGEIADHRIRGGLCVLIPVMFELGRVISFVMGVWVSREALSIVGAVISIIFATSLLWSPESPYYFAMKNLPNKVQESVAWLRGTSDVVQEVQQIQNSATLNQRRFRGILALFRVSGNRKALLIITGLLFCRVSSDFLIIFYESYVAMISSSDYVSFYVTTVTITRLLSILTAFYVAVLAEKLGRRPLLLASVSLSTVIALVAVLYHLLLVEKIGDGLVWLVPIIISAGYAISISIGIGTLPFVFAGELFSSDIKSIALAITFSSYFIAQFLVFMLFSFLIRVISAAIIGIPIVLIFLSGVFVYLAVPETKGRSLSEIQTGLNPQFNRQV